MRCRELVRYDAGARRFAERRGAANRLATPACEGCERCGRCDGCEALCKFACKFILS